MSCSGWGEKMGQRPLAVFGESISQSDKLLSIFVPDSEVAAARSVCLIRGGEHSTIKTGHSETHTT